MNMEMEMMQAIIATLGFPIAITVYLLWERQNVTKCLEAAIKNDLAGAINDLREQIVILNERLVK